MLLIRLYFEFFKTGLFAVGGGLATLPFLYHMAETTGWFTSSDVTNLIAISESTPGAIGVNAATYVGFLSGGVPGAVIATLGLVSPAIIVMLIIVKMLTKFKESTLVQNVFYGLRPASSALIASSGLLVIKNAFLTFLPSGGIRLEMRHVLLGVIILILTQKTKFHPIIYILFSAVVGILFLL